MFLIQAVKQSIGCSQNEHIRRYPRDKPDRVLQKSFADEWLRRLAWKKVLKDQKKRDDHGQRRIKNKFPGKIPNLLGNPVMIERSDGNSFVNNDVRLVDYR